MDRTQGISHFLLQAYCLKGDLTQEEYNQVEHIRQIVQYLQAQKAQADQNLWREMMKHLAKTVIKR